MHIKNLFKDEAEYQQWFQSLLDIATNPSAPLWREEDRLKLEPFFRWNDRMNNRRQPGDEAGNRMTTEEAASFEHYKQCECNYGRELSEKRNSLMQFGFEELCDIFGFELVEPDNDDSDVVQLSPEFGYEFPLIVLGDIESDYHRGSPDRAASITILSLKEFNLVVDEEPKLDHDLQPIKNYNEDSDER